MLLIFFSFFLVMDEDNLVLTWNEYGITYQHVLHDLRKDVSTEYNAIVILAFEAN